MTVHEQLRSVRRALREVSSEADWEAQLILAHVYGTTPGALTMRLLHEAAGTEETEEIVRARLEGRPLAYILKSAPFFGADYYVDERVLIPRFDTEPVVEAALDRIRSRQLHTAADVCCGSGCIGITLLREADLSGVVFTDISSGALDVAAENARRLAPGRAVQFCRGDLLEALPGPADIIISNPPYIAAAEMASLEKQVRDFEPPLALCGGRDGLDFYRRLAAGAAAWLNPGGVLITEIGDTQAGAVAALYAKAGLEDIETGKDLGGRPRWIAGVRR